MIYYSQSQHLNMDFAFIWQYVSRVQHMNEFQNLHPP